MTPEQAFDEHHREVYRFLYRLTGRGDLAEDITQDCFLALVRKPSAWNSERSGMRTYLFSIARNLAYKFYRDAHSELMDEERAEALPDRCTNVELSAAVAQMISLLPDLQREVLILFEYEGLQLVEIAEIVKADVGTVKSRLHRARKRLKGLLAPYRRVVTHDNA